MKDLQVFSILDELQALGIKISQYEESFVENTLQKRMDENGCSSPEAYLSLLKGSQDEVKALESMLQNSYSEFFRNPLTFAVLEKIVLPSLAAEKRQGGKELRIWSAACASGQEPYSLAMLLEENEIIRKDPLRYRIFATDKSKIQIDNAQKGYYSSYRLGQVSLKRLSKWFKDGKTGSDNTLYKIKGELKKNIDFSVFDVLEENGGVPPSSIFGGFDLVFCANLLFYYKPAYREIIFNKIIKSLNPNGLLVVGESERELVMQHGFIEMYYHSGIFRF